MKRFNIILIFLVILMITPQVHAEDEDVYDSESQAIVVETESLRSQNLEPGRYAITIKYYFNNKVLTKDIYINIVEDEPMILGSISIQAQPITVLSADIKNYTALDWIEKTKAHAWNNQTYEIVPITFVDASNVDIKNGEYSLLIGTDENTYIEVMVSVIGEEDNQEIVKHYYETYYQDNDSDQQNLFESFNFTTLSISAIIMLLIPLIILLGQYLWTSKALKKTHQILDDE